MASFEKQSSSNDAVHQKYPIRRLEHSVKKFVKVLEIDLDRLDRHRQNIERLSIQEKWVLLNKEQINSSRTVQQIKANIREIEKARAQIVDEDLHKFDDWIEEVKLKAIKAVEEFILLSQSGSSSPTEEMVINPESETAESSSSSSIQYGTSYTPAYNIRRPNIPADEIFSCSLPNASDISQIQKMANPHPTTINPETVASWEHLQEDLVDLNTMIHQYSAVVQEQEEKVDTIEDKIETAYTGVQQGTSSLGQAAKYKAAIFPVAGAVIGGVLGGPIGLVAGLKLGGAAAVSGGVVGFFGGRYLKKRQDKVTEVELNNLSVTRSTSLEDISSTTVKNTS
ncbi:syntaxin-17-like [Patella vulgata]|uniref:syntaxin-17-like n=1 Tax=Patella vulgata TaxID=6465 RepID=UPI002180763E|nr:syntaxin-17-like [Patella vulgata]XP_050418692.1 syntaxin-17-like [Patella vulgata]